MYKTMNSEFQSLIDSNGTTIAGSLSLVTDCANVELVIADRLYGLGKEKWDQKEHMWMSNEFIEGFILLLIFKFCKVRMFYRNPVKFEYF